jgi:hypothetical protein
MELQPLPEVRVKECPVKMNWMPLDSRENMLPISHPDFFDETPGGNQANLRLAWWTRRSLLGGAPFL